MNQNWKDSARQSTHRTALEVTKNRDGTYDIVFNEEVVGSRIGDRLSLDEVRVVSVRVKRSCFD